MGTMVVVREIALRADEAAKVQDFIGKLRSASGAAVEPGLGDWLTWAEERLSEWDPLNAGVKAVMRDVQSVTDRDYRD